MGGSRPAQIFIAVTIVVLLQRIRQFHHHSFASHPNTAARKQATHKPVRSGIYNPQIRKPAISPLV